jgi:hypothetical protein
MTVNIAQVLPADKVGDAELRSVRIGQAYAAVFRGVGTREDADLVLVDLAQLCGYYDTASVTADPQVVLAMAHRRAVLQLILAQSGGEPSGFMAAVLTAPNPYDTEENVS